MVTTLFQHCSAVLKIVVANRSVQHHRNIQQSWVRLNGAIHVPQHLLYSHHAPSEIFLCVCSIESKKIRYYLGFLAWRLFLFLFFDNVIEITVCYSPSESQDPSSFKSKRVVGGIASYLEPSCWTLYFRSMQEVQLDKHVKLVDSPGIVMDNSNSDSAVILRNCVKVRFHSVVQEWPTLIFS